MRIVKRFLLTILCLMALCTGALAAGQTGSIILHFNLSDGPVAGAVFRAYQAAERLDDGSFVLTSRYAGYPVDLSIDAQTLAGTLAGYTRRDQIPCTAMGVTDADGVLTLPELPAGLYLVTGDVIETDFGAVLPSEIVLSVPARNGAGWSFDVDADVKSEVKPPEGPETVVRRALKIWDDAGYETERPEEITVQLLRDGEIYDTVSLSAENNWRCSWSELDAACRWEVVEKECPGYTVKAEKNGVTFTLTNTRILTDRPEKPDLPEKPANRLPQTGQLWWPVPLLALTGAALLILGVRKRKSHEA